MVRHIYPCPLNNGNGPGALKLIDSLRTTFNSLQRLLRLWPLGSDLSTSVTLPNRGSVKKSQLGDGCPVLGSSCWLAVTVIDRSADLRVPPWPTPDSSRVLLHSGAPTRQRSASWCACVLQLVLLSPLTARFYLALFAPASVCFLRTFLERMLGPFSMSACTL